MNFEVVGYVASGITTLQISEERYRVVKSAKATCLFATELEEKFALLIDNFYELETELLKLAEASRIWPNRDHRDTMLERLTIDRRLVNLLTACRLYVDQTDHGISALFGKFSNDLNRIKLFKNQLYDDCWGYRFMEALRNHVQHSGLPIHIISHNSARVSGVDQDYSQYTVVPQTSVKKLAENSSFKKAILTELQEMGEQIDLRPAIREYIDCFCRLHERIRETITAKLANDRPVYEAAIVEYSNIEGVAVRFPHLHKTNEDGTADEEIALVAHFLDYLDPLRLRNPTNRNLSRTFSANTDQKRS
jgi:hypothetical protein